MDELLHVRVCHAMLLHQIAGVGAGRVDRLHQVLVADVRVAQAGGVMPQANLGRPGL